MVALDDARLAPNLDEANRLVIEHTQEARRAAAVLDIGLPFCIDSSEKNARLRPNECSKIGRYPCLPRAAFFHVMVRLAGALTSL